MVGEDSLMGKQTSAELGEKQGPRGVLETAAADVRGSPQSVTQGVLGSQTQESCSLVKRFSSEQ